MKYIIDYITLFFSEISRIFELIGDITTQIFKLLGNCFTFLFSAVSALPSAITIASIALIAVCVIYKIVGREGGEAS